MLTVWFKNLIVSNTGKALVLHQERVIKFIDNSDIVLPASITKKMERPMGLLL